VMSTLAYVDSETITQADRAQSSRVPVPLPDDPYVAVGQAKLVAPSENHTYGCAYSADPILGHVSLNSGATALSLSSFRKRYISSYETPSPSSSSTLSGRRILRRIRRIRVRMRTTRERERESQGLGDEGQGLEDEGLGLEEEKEAVPEGQQQAILVVNTAAGEPLGLGYGALRCRELAVGEDQVPSTFEVGQSFRSMPDQQGAERVSVFRQPIFNTLVDPEDGRVYIDILAYVPLAAPVQTPPSPKWSIGSLPVSPSSPVVLSPIAFLVATPTTTISVDDDQFLEVGGNIDRDVRELYTRSGAIRDEIFLQRYRFRSLGREQERATMTFGALLRAVLALEWVWQKIPNPMGKSKTQSFWSKARHAYRVSRRIREHYTRKDSSIRSPTRIRAGLGEHLALMERFNKIPIGDRGGFEVWFANQAAMQRELQEIRGRVTALEQERRRREP
nr:hypothetical protein [Tanacetum cinerariifolium]